MRVAGVKIKLISGLDDCSRFCVIATVVRRATGRAVCRAFVGPFESMEKAQVAVDGWRAEYNHERPLRPAAVMNPSAPGQPSDNVECHAGLHPGPTGTWLYPH
jgi:hypothetical protein